MAPERTYLEALQPGSTPETEVWEEPLRAACETLARTREDLITSIDVTGRLGHVEAEAQYLLALSKRLAVRYGLKEVVEVRDHRFTVRFWRRAPEPHKIGGRL